MKICLPFYENPNYIPYKENNYEDSSFVVKMTSGFFIGDVISKGRAFDEYKGIYYPSIEKGRNYIILSPQCFSDKPTLSELSDYEYQTAIRIFNGDMITVSDDVLDNNNFFDKKSFNFIKKTNVILSENNEKITCSVMEKIPQ